MSVLGRKIFLHGACIRYAVIIFYFYSSAAVLSGRVVINEVAELLHSEEETFMAMSKAPYKRMQHFWMCHVTPVCTPCCMLLHVFRSCCTNFETTPNISLSPWLPKCTAQHNNVGSVCTALPGTRLCVVGKRRKNQHWQKKSTTYPFFAFFPHCKAWSQASLGQACALLVVLRVVSFPWCTAGHKIVGSCWICLHTTAKQVHSNFQQC